MVPNENELILGLSKAILDWNDGACFRRGQRRGLLQWDEDAGLASRSSSNTQAVTSRSSSNTQAITSRSSSNTQAVTSRSSSNTQAATSPEQLKGQRRGGRSLRLFGVLGGGKSEKEAQWTVDDGQTCRDKMVVYSLQVKP